VDLDLGNYERFLDVELTRDHNITTGKVYSTVIEKERRGEYLGRRCRSFPTSLRRSRGAFARFPGRAAARSVSSRWAALWAISSPCLPQAMRQLKYEESGNIFLRACNSGPSTMDGEQKTKPTQHSVKVMRELGCSRI